MQCNWPEIKMARVWLLLALALIGGAQAQIVEEGNFQTTKVSVYYSVMCNNCRAFFTAKLEPYYHGLNQWFELDLVPFGNSTHLDGGFEFSCPDGPDECVANKWQSCATALYGATKPDELFQFVNCTLWSDSLYFEVLKKCADDNYLDFLSIQHCTNGFEGNLHLAANAARTTEHDPQIISYPTIEFNGTYDQELQDLAVKDFRKALCSQIKDPTTGAVPKACTAGISQVLPFAALLAATLAFGKLIA